MRILWVSNAPWVPTGYGAQTRQIVQRLAAAGHEVAVFCNYGIHGQINEKDGIRFYPNNGDSYGNELVGLWADDWFRGQPGWIITLYDTWTFDPKAYERFNVACWTPVDHLMVPPRVKGWFQKSSAVPIAMSEFGRDALADNDLRPEYAPHGIDIEAFAPRDREEARRLVGAPSDCFLVGMVAANLSNQPIRKGFDLAMRAFQTLRQEVPEAKLYVHSRMDGAHGKGVDLDVLGTQYGISADDMWFPNRFRYEGGLISEAEMSYYYSAMDVLLAPSLGEGFGIPVVEAQASGTPVIVSDGTAQRELCGSGWRVATQPSYDPLLAADWHLPLLKDLVHCLAEAYLARGDQELRTQARVFAEQYDADRVFDAYWRPILEKLETAVVPASRPLSVV